MRFMKLVVDTVRKVLLSQQLSPLFPGELTVGRDSRDLRVLGV